MDSLIYVFIVVFGLAVGSFLNCLVFRLESGETLLGRSYCRSCKKSLGLAELVPVASFLLQSGKCSNCHIKLSWQYLVVEFATALVFMAMFWKFQQAGLFIIAFWWCVSASLITIFAYDMRKYEIPDVVLFPAIGIALAYRFWPTASLPNFLLAAAVGSLFFAALHFGSKGAWMGFGDAKLAVLLGLLTGFPGILVALFVAFLLGGVLGAILLFLDKKGMKSQLPFAPFLILGTAASVFWGQQIVSWYLKLLTI